MTNTNSHSSKSISQIIHDLEEIQHHLLMIKAAGLAYSQYFNDAAPNADCKSSYDSNETAEYFVYRFLELAPDAKIEAAMDAIWQLDNQLNPNSNQSTKPKNEDTIIKISIGRD